MQFSVLYRFQEPMFFLLRFMSGVLFACHGAQKLFGVLGGQQASGAMMITAGVVEFFGGLLIAAGLVTQVTAFLCAGEMAVAYMMAHMGRGFWPIQNGGELALLYLFIFLLILVRGGGRFSLDLMLFEPERNRQGV